MNLNDLNIKIATLSIVEQLEIVANIYPEKVKFSTSFGNEDQIISHLIFVNKLPIEVFTLDTGRLFQETYSVWNATLEKYKTPIKAYFPPSNEVEKLLYLNGPNSFYESIEKRKNCCHIRKVIPLQKALKNTAIWITGLRQGQSQNRQAVNLLEQDNGFNLIKFQPLWNWSFEQVKNFIKDNNIPYHSLHDKGFPSIGCQPCTRAIKEGEDFRAGRWWWENNSQKECGLHSNK